jgi:ribosomal protein L37AE/L43A
MPINKIQFQPGLSLPRFFAQFGTEAQCEAALEQARWPSGFVCPDCGEHRHSLVHRRDQKVWQCTACRKQTSLTAGTIFEATRLPLRLWFLGIYHLTQPKNNVSALELKRLLGVSYKAAWRLKHKLMQVMDEREADRVLGERVALDDAYLGGAHPGKVGRGAEGKVPFVVAVQTSEEEHRLDEHWPWYVRLDPLPGFTKKALGQWAQCALAPDALMVSDGLACFAGAAELVSSHERVVVGERKSSELECFHWVNTLLGNIKSSIQGTYHGFKSDKYAARYLGELHYRFNRRFDLPPMVQRLLRACALTTARPEKWLRSAEAWG